MPLTHAHPAIIIPLKRWWPGLFCWTGLIIGSMAPDFEYYARAKPFGYTGHMWWGVWVVDLPLTWLVALVFHRVIKGPLLRAAPAKIQDWLGPAAARPFPERVRFGGWRFVFSSVVGAYSHIIWDSFTHRGEWPVKHFAVLHRVVHFGAWQPPMYKFLQVAFSVLGIAVILIYLWIDYLKSEKPAVPEKTDAWFAGKFWGIAVGIFLLVWFLLLPARGIRLNAKTWATYVVRLTDGVVAGILISSVALRKQAAQASEPER